MCNFCMAKKKKERERVKNEWNKCMYITKQRLPFTYKQLIKINEENEQEN